MVAFAVAWFWESTCCGARTTRGRRKPCGEARRPPNGCAHEKGTDHGDHRTGWLVLAELLLEKGYEVHGIIRRAARSIPGGSTTPQRSGHLRPHVLPALRRYDRYQQSEPPAEKVEPDEIYNLAAQSHVKVSFEVPEYTAEVDGVGTLRFLDAIRERD